MTISERLQRWIFDWFTQKWLPANFRAPKHIEYFRLAQQRGYHILPNAFYTPIPDTSTLPSALWEQPSSMPGVSWNDERQRELALQVFPQYRSEFEQFPLQASADPYMYYQNNDYFVGLDAIALHCLVRHFRPQRVIEVGSGFSTRITSQALQRNGSGELVCIEPYPNPVLRSLPGVSQLIEQPVQQLPLDLFTSLQAGDILFIDSTHTVKIGSDVNYLVLEVLPNLQPGVLVHFHDIFLPREYPHGWITQTLMFSNEQYLLQAFLAFNDAFTVEFSSAYLTVQHAQQLEAQFGNFSRWNEGCSLWMRKVR
jgi:predicted O-methyltransferase YrrM